MTGFTPHTHPLSPLSPRQAQPRCCLKAHARAQRLLQSPRSSRREVDEAGRKGRGASAPLQRTHIRIHFVLPQDTERTADSKSCPQTKTQLFHLILEKEQQETREKFSLE